MYDQEVREDGGDSTASGSNRLHWNLGFLVEVKNSKDRVRLLRHHFPSKVGSLPAWLDPVDLPTKRQLTCPQTGKPMRFLLQLYAPVDDVPHAFHRTIFLFVSPAGNRLQEPGYVRAFRCQLPRVNPFYPSTPATVNDEAPPALNIAQLEVALARDPWQVALHEARKRSDPLPASTDAPKLFKEHELVVEEEAASGSDLEDEATDASGPLGNTASAQRSVKHLLAQYHGRVAAEGEFTEDDLPEGALDAVEEQLTPEMRHFAEFSALMASAPDQVVRYSFEPGAQPIAPYLKPPPPGATTIPTCPRCGARRQFEFQVLPQILNFLGDDATSADAPDFGTIAVYSCMASCPQAGGSVADALESDAYMEEFVWVQPPDEAVP